MARRGSSSPRASFRGHYEPTLLQSYVHNVRWMRVPSQHRPALKYSILSRLAQRFCQSQSVRPLRAVTAETEGVSSCESVQLLASSPAQYLTVTKEQSPSVNPGSAAALRRPRPLSVAGFPAPAIVPLPTAQAKSVANSHSNSARQSQRQAMRSARSLRCHPGPIWWNRPSPVGTGSYRGKNESTAQ